MAKTLELLQHALAERYRIERELGRGGMATVFLAEDLKHRRRVAIKVLDPEVAAAIGPERFLREIETVAKLSHPHILPLHDSGEANGLLFYVMPFVAGESLRDRLTRAQQLPLEEALRLTREVAAALEHAHRQGVVHRDIKPENILLQEGQALVADFGIARAVDAAGVKRLTTSAVMLGTPAYMSPEQAAGGAVDARADLYGLGCVLYELLAGQAPYTGPTAESVIFQHLNAAPPHVTAMRPAVPAGLDRVIVKAMAKSPADRYGSVAEFVAALEAGLTEEAERPGAKRRAVWSAVIIAVPVLALVAIAAWQAWWPFGGAGGPPPAKKDWILVAEFDGPPGDSTLAPAARSLLSAALDQSRLVATVSQDQIQQALETAGKPPGTRLSPTVAKELAYRSAVRTVLEGTIGRLGTGYSIVVRLVDADTARVLFTESGTAKGDDALIPAMGELAKRLRRGLGENRRALAATRPLTLAATPSFEAYRLYVAGKRKQDALDYMNAIPLYRQAVGLDPDFATAWGEMSYCYWCQSSLDSMRVCLAEALRRPDRLTFAQRQLLEARRLNAEGDYLGALTAEEQLVGQNPESVIELQNLIEPLLYNGRYQQCLDWTRRAMALSPFGPTVQMRWNESVSLDFLRRFSEERESLRPLTGYLKIRGLLELEMATGRYAVAESLATAHLQDPDITSVHPGAVQLYLSTAQAARGAVRAAVATDEEALAIISARRDVLSVEQVHTYTNFIRQYLMSLSDLSWGAIPLLPDTLARDNSITSMLTHGLRAALAGDGQGARRLLDAARARPARELSKEGYTPAFLEAQIAVRAGQPQEAVRLLRPIAVQRVDVGAWATLSVSRVWVRWALANAFEQMGQPDSAAFYLERILLPEWSTVNAYWEVPYVEQRLALLYVRMGRIADAERHLAAAEQSWDRPDPAIRHLIAEARTAIVSAREEAPSRR